MQKQNAETKCRNKMQKQNRQKPDKKQNGSPYPILLFFIFLRGHQG